MTTTQNSVSTTGPKGLAAATGAPRTQILKDDIIIPRLLLMQGLSDLVTERKAQMGDMVRSTSGEKLGDPTQPLRFTPLRVEAEWSDQEKVGGRFEFRSRTPRTAKNDTLPWKYYKTADGVEHAQPVPGSTEWQRQKVLNVYALLVEDIERYDSELKKVAASGELPDPDKFLMPVLISFRSMSFPAGKTLMTFLAQLEDYARRGLTVKMYNYAMELTCYQDKNDKGTFYVYKLGKTSKLPEQYTTEAALWYDRVNSGSQIKVDADPELEAATGDETRF